MRGGGGRGGFERGNVTLSVVGEVAVTKLLR
jgi:hypothetical protein